MDEVSTTIAAPPERVWAVVTNITEMGRWSPGCTGGKWAKGATGPAVGARFTGSNKHGLMRWATHCTVVECEEPSRFAFQVEENNTQWGWKLEPTGDGGTKLTQWRNRVAEPPMLARLTAKVVFSGKLDETMVDGMRKTLAALKTDLEGAATNA